MNAEHTNSVIILLSLAIQLFAARVMGELARRFRQPVVLGELFAGLMLGPTLLGAVAPGIHQALFPMAGPVQEFYRGFTLLAVVLFILVAGLEVDLSTIWRQGKVAIVVGLSGIIPAFSLGFLAAWIAPESVGATHAAKPLIFASFLGVALSISALPVIAKTLMDLRMYRTEFGMVVIAAAMIDDLLGWFGFAIVLRMLHGAENGGPGLVTTIGMTVGFALFVLTVGRGLIHRALPWVQAHLSWPGGVLGFSLALALFGAAFTEWIGIHAIFGSFLIGIAIGDSPHLREQTRQTIHQFISFIFAPLFFSSIGLRIDFVANFDARLTAVILLLAIVGKVAGCTAGARLGGVGARESWAVGFAMNARGAMEIILGLLALQAGLIGDRLFVSLVVMAIVTSMISGPVIRRVMRLRPTTDLSDYLVPRGFLPSLGGRDRGSVIRELAEAVATTGVDREALEWAVMERESLGPTGMGNRIAVPHARLAGLARPYVALGVSAGGVDFDAPDGEPAELIFLVVTPKEDNGAQVLILAEIARRFADDAARAEARNLKSYTELLAFLRTRNA